MKNSRDFAELPLGKLIIRCALPATISMSAIALYSIIDGVFVGYFLGATALAAVNLVMPIFMLVSAVIDMIAAGSSVQIAARLGAGKNGEACRILTSSLLAIFLVSIAVAVVIRIGTEPFLHVIGADPAVIREAATYLYILAGASPLFLYFFAMDNYLRICGWQNYSMGVNVGTAFLSIFLDYLMIVRWNWGIEGAALATAVSLTAGAWLNLLPFLAHRTELRFVRHVIPFRQFRKLAFNGSSDFFDSTASSLMSLIVNAVLIKLGGTLAVAAFSVVMYLDSVVSMLVFGLTSSLQPAISYCYGAKLRERTRRLQKYIMIGAALLSLSALVLLKTAGPWALTFFVTPGDTTLMNLSLATLSAFALSYLVKWVDICVSSYFTALEHPKISLFLSMVGTLLAPLAGLALLVPLLGLPGVWYMPFCAGLLSALLSIVCLKKFGSRY